MSDPALDLLPQQIANGPHASQALVVTLHPWRPSPEASADAELWLKALQGDLARQREAFRKPREYHAGIQPLMFATEKYAETFGAMLKASCENWLDLVVAVTSERLRIVGVQARGNAGDSFDPAWELWQRSGLDSDSHIAHTDAMVCGRSYLLAAPGPDGARITVEDPALCVTRHAPGDRRRRVAGLKLYADNDGHTAWVFLPDTIHVFKGNKDAQGWEEVEQTRNPLGVVPLVPVINRPSALGHGESDLAPVLPGQDTINKFANDIIIDSEFDAFRQKVILGWEPASDAELPSAHSRMWTINKPPNEVGIQEFSSTDLSGKVAAKQEAIRSLAARTRTPPHYLLGGIINASGDALKASETGLTAKATERQRWYSESWEEALALGLRLDGEMVDPANLEVAWADPESRTEGELVDALVKMRTLGVPFEELWARWGATPQQVEEWKKQRGLPSVPPPGATGADDPSISEDEVPLAAQQFALAVERGFITREEARSRLGFEP